MTDILETRLAFLANGYEPLPAIGKAVKLNGWTTVHLDADTVRQHRADFPTHTNTSVRTGSVIAVDIDVLDEAVVDAIEVEALMILGSAPLRRVGKAPKCLLVFRSDDPSRRKATTPRFMLEGQPARVEILGSGQQFVALGTHPDTGREYVWNDGKTPANVPVADLTIVTAEGIREFLTQAELILRGAGATAETSGPVGGHTSAAVQKDAAYLAPPDAASVVALLERMPNPDTLDREEYAKIMLAAHGCIVGLKAIGQFGEDDAELIADAACEWAAKWPDSEGYDAERKKWDVDWSKRNEVRSGWSALQLHADRLMPGYLAEWALDEATRQFDNDGPAPRGSSLRDRFLFPADCATGPRRGYLIKHFLAPGDVAALIGPPGAGKSILAPHLAYALAQGRSTFGLRTKPGRILYLAAEDFSGMRQRIHALTLRYGDSPNFAVVDVENLSDPATADDLRAAVAHWEPSLVVLDTLGAAFAGMDENSAQDMGGVVKLARRLAATGAAVLLIHHIAKHGDGSPRGHSVLNGTLDMCLSLASKGNDGVIRGMLTKNRNGTTDRDIAFRFEAVELGQDEDGDAVTAPRAIELDPRDTATAALPKLSRGATNALCLLYQMAASRESVPEEAWRASCEDERLVSVADKAESRSKAFRRAYAELRDAGFVTTRTEQVFLTGDGQSAGSRAMQDRAGQGSTSQDGSEFNTPEQFGEPADAAWTQSGQAKVADSLLMDKLGQGPDQADLPRAKQVVVRTDTDRSLRSVQSSATDADGNEIGDSHLHNPTGTGPAAGLGGLLQ